jgi:hypothetical protein
MISNKDKATGVASLALMLGFFGIVPAIIYATRTPVDYKRSRYWVRPNDKTTVEEFNGILFKTLYDQDKDGLVDVVNEGRWGGRLFPFKMSRNREPTEIEQEIFESVLARLYNKSPN